MRRGGDRRFEETSPEELEECCSRAKDDLGLDHCEARSWHGWPRHMSLCMAALAFLSKLSADLRRSAWSKPNESLKEPIAARSGWLGSSRACPRSAISSPGSSSSHRHKSPSSSHGRYGDDDIGPQPPFVTTNGVDMRNL